jgi:hypothetical protein
MQAVPFRVRAPQVCFFRISGTFASQCEGRVRQSPLSRSRQRACCDSALQICHGEVPIGDSFDYPAPGHLVELIPTAGRTELLWMAAGTAGMVIRTAPETLRLI